MILLYPFQRHLLQKEKKKGKTHVVFCCFFFLFAKPQMFVGVCSEVFTITLFFCERRTVPTHCQSWSDEGALNFRIQCHFSQGSSLIHNLTVISYWNRTRRYKKLHFDFGLPLYHLHLPQKNPKNFNIKARLRVGFVSSVAHDGHTSSPQSRGY